MTLKQFFEKYNEIEWRYLFAWQANASPLRGKFCGMCMCPITAVCLEVTCRTYSVSDWPTAAKYIGLSDENAWEIVNAADTHKEVWDALRCKAISGGVG